MKALQYMLDRMEGLKEKVSLCVWSVVGVGSVSVVWMDVDVLCLNGDFEPFYIAKVSTVCMSSRYRVGDCNSAFLL